MTAKNQFKDNFDIDNKETLNKRIAKNINKVHREKRTRTEKIADFVVGFMGRWSFIIAFLIIVAGWEIYNNVAHNPFDPYPYILLTGYLSVFVIPQGSIILMSQARQDAKDRLRDELDYKINAKNEILIEEILKRITQIEERQRLEKDLWENRGE
jgi:uncharacterized membrane protein